MQAFAMPARVAAVMLPCRHGCTGEREAMPINTVHNIGASAV